MILTACSIKCTIYPHYITKCLDINNSCFTTYDNKSLLNKKCYAPFSKLRKRGHTNHRPFLKGMQPNTIFLFIINGILISKMFGSFITVISLLIWTLLESVKYSNSLIIAAILSFKRECMRVKQQSTNYGNYIISLLHQAPVNYVGVLFFVTFKIEGSLLCYRQIIAQSHKLDLHLWAGRLVQRGQLVEREHKRAPT